jgi:Protein of unknown function (DUF3570)
MKRIFLSAAAIMGLIYAHAQNTTDSSAFKSRRLKLDEINLVSSYYSQDGNNAAVTGGIGSQKLTDIAATIDVRLTRYDKKLRKHTFDGEIGIDHYTSASSDKVDLKANSSASHADTRIYPSLSWTIENELKGTSVGIGISASTEFDYQSFGASLSFSKKTKNKSGEFSAKLQAYLDKVSLVLPTELRANPMDDEDDYAATARNSYSGSLSWTQIINQRLQVAIIADVISQTGYLSMPFYRVYFNDASVHQEKLPDSRTKLPLGIRANYFLGDKVILRSYYRYYSDSWGLHSHTANLEVPIKVNPFLSISPFYRFYTQTAIKYFNPYGVHTAQDTYYSSNYDLSKFTSHFFGAGVKITPPKGVFGYQRFNMVEIRYGHYAKNIGMNANSITLSLRFK